MALLGPGGAGDRVLSDAEWGQMAASVVERTGFAPEGDDRAVRWVAVRHAADHIHIVTTLARQDGRRVKTWNDFFRVREACRAAERRLGLTATAPADRTAAKRASRAETEQAARRGWDEAPRVTLRREVRAAAAGAGSEREFFARLEKAGVLVRKRLSTVHPGEVTGYAVGLADHTTKDGSVIWYGGGKLAADLTLPKLRARWAGSATARSLGAPVHGVMARAVLRARVIVAAGQARDDAGFFAQLREAGVLVRLRYSETIPGEVTGYAVALPGHAGQDGEPRWYGGARLASGLTLAQLRQWDRQPAAPGSRPDPFRFTAPEWEAFCRHAARQAEAAAEQIRRSTGGDPTAAADMAWAAAAAFHATARAIRDPALRRAADMFDRAARAAHGKIPYRTTEGDRLRAAARLLAMAGSSEAGTTPTALHLAASLVRLAGAVVELRQAQQHAAQAAAARKAAEGLHAALSRSRAGAAALGVPTQARPAQTIRKPGDAARLDFPVPLQPGPLAPHSSGHVAPQPSPRPRPTPNASTRASPGR